jgi:hypothetical protein
MSLPALRSPCNVRRLYDARIQRTQHSDLPVPVFLRPVILVFNVTFLLREPTVLYYIAYVTVTWLGNFVSPFFFCYHLLDIVYRYETLKSVMQSVTRNGRQLLMTAVLMSVLIYIYAIIGFLFFRQTYFVSGVC